MPNPTPSPSAGLAPSPAPSVPTLPDGTPDYGRASGQAAATTGKTSIWNIPTGVNPNQPIWFDIGHSTANEQTLDMKTGKTNNIASITSHQIMASPTKIMRQYAALSANDPQAFIAIQKLLASGPWGKVNETGAFDANTESALGQAMAQYLKLSHGAGVAMSFSEYLQKTAATAQALGGDGTSLKQGSAPPPINLTDPAEIKAAAQSAFQDALGKGATSDQLDAFVKKFQSAQTSAQLTTSGSMSMPDLSSQSMAYAQKADPQGFKDNQRTSFLDQLVNLLGGSRPNQAPVPGV